MAMNKVGAQLLISLAIILPFWGLLYLVFIYGMRLDPASQSLFKDIMIQVVPIVTAIIGFWIGSSHGSATKDQVIADMAKEKV